MRLHYTSRLLTEQFQWHEPVLPETSSLYSVYHGSLAERLTSSEKGFFLGLMERREDGVYFVPDKDNIGGTLVRKSQKRENGDFPKGVSPSRDIKKLKPACEALEVFDVQGNHLATIRVSD